MECSVIVLSYNNSLEQILLTVKSILHQKNTKVEIIFADDCSKCSYEQEIRMYLEKYKFFSYQFADHSKNLGTVKNILRALKYCKGKYVKCIGAGDLFYDENVLNNVISTMKRKKLNFLFTDLSSYKIFDKRIIKINFRAPLVIRPYKNSNSKKVLNNLIRGEDFISGSTMFFEKEFLLLYLKKIENIVVYIEDIMQVLIVLDIKEIPYYMPIKGIIYEVGAGISTQKKNKENKNKMHHDDERFWEYVVQNYSRNEVIMKKKHDLEIRRNYGGFRNILARFFINPEIFLRNYVRNHIPYCSGIKLGFLDREEFVREFCLKR